MELRERVVSAYLAGEGTYEELAESFAVSRSWVKKMVRQYRERGDLKPQTFRCGRKPTLTERDRQRLAELVRKHPDLTLEQFRERLGFACCIQTIWHALKRLRQTFKKDSTCRRARSTGRPGCSETTSLACPAA